MGLGRVQAEGLLNQFQREGVLPLLIGQKSTQVQAIAMRGELSQDLGVAFFRLRKSFGLMMANRL